MAAFSSRSLSSSIIIGLILLVFIDFFPTALEARSMGTLPAWVLEIIGVAVGKGRSVFGMAINVVQFVNDVCNNQVGGNSIVQSVLEEITIEISRAGTFAREARQAVCEKLNEGIAGSNSPPAGGGYQYPGNGAGYQFPGNGRNSNPSASALPPLSSLQLIVVQLVFALLANLPY